MIAAVLAMAMSGQLLDHDWTSGITAKGVAVVCIGRVEKKGDKFLYTYRIVNKHKTATAYVSWDTIGHAMGYGGRPMEYLWEIKPGKEAKVSILHKDEPVETLGRMDILSRDGHKDLLKAFTGEGGIETPPFLMFQGAGGTGAPLPRSLVPKAVKAS